MIPSCVFRGLKDTHLLAVFVGDMDMFLGSWVAGSGRDEGKGILKGTGIDFRAMHGINIEVFQTPKYDISKSSHHISGKQSQLITNISIPLRSGVSFALQRLARSTPHPVQPSCASPM